MPAQATEQTQATEIAPQEALQEPPHPLIAAIQDDRVRAAAFLSDSGIPLMRVHVPLRYSDRPWNDWPIITIPVPDIYAPRELLQSVYTREALQQVAAACDATVIECAACHIPNVIRNAGGVQFSSYEEEEPLNMRKYFPHTMNGHATRNGHQYLCTHCASAGYSPCQHCGTATLPYRRSRSCETCYKANSARNRRSRDNYVSFSRINDQWKAEEGDGIYYGVELEYSEIEGKKRLSEFMKTAAFPLSSYNLKVKGDGSVSHGFEINCGKGTWQQVTTDIGNICKAMQFFPHTGQRAGYHIHASFNLESPSEQKKLYMRVASLYSAIEPLLFAAVPAWRQENEFAGRTFDAFRAPEWIEENYSSQRYKALNITAINAHGTLEWRLFPSSSRADILTGYLSVVQWLMATVWERREETHEEWSKRFGKMENARDYLAEAFAQSDAPNFRFLSRALSSLSIPPRVMDFLIERIGYNIVQNIKYEKETPQKSVFTDRDRSIPAYSYETDRNTKTMAALKNVFKSSTSK